MIEDKDKKLEKKEMEAILENLSIKTIDIEWLSGDGSNRKYYRLKDPSSGSSFVMMKLSHEDTVLLKEEKYEWIIMSRLMEQYGIRVPNIIKVIPSIGCIIMEDCSDIMVETLIFNNKDDDEKVVDIYKKVLGIYLKMLSIPQDGSLWCERSFDCKKFKWELDFFIKNYLNSILNINLSSQEESIYEKQSLELSKKIAERSQYFVHRDFHSRNIMYKDNDFIVIDFQDARLGPISYDLISLIYDNYTPLSIDKKDQIFKISLDLIKKENESFYNKILEEYPLVLLQRQLKAIGSYGYLTTVKKRDYLHYVPVAVESIDRVFKSRDDFNFLTKDLLKKIKERIF